MTTERKQRLEKTVADLQQRFGLRAIGRAETRAIPVISTGFPTLDEALGVGGLPRGRLSEIVGIPTSGMATLALQIVAQAQQEVTGQMAAYWIWRRHSTPTTRRGAAWTWGDCCWCAPTPSGRPWRCCPTSPSTAASACWWSIARRACWPTAPRPKRWPTTLGRIIAPLNRSGCALVFLSGLPPGRPPPSSDRLPAPERPAPLRLRAPAHPARAVALPSAGRGRL